MHIPSSIIPPFRTSRLSLMRHLHQSLHLSRSRSRTIVRCQPSPTSLNLVSVLRPHCLRHLPAAQLLSGSRINFMYILPSIDSINTSISPWGSILRQLCVLSKHRLPTLHRSGSPFPPNSVARKPSFEPPYSRRQSFAGSWRLGTSRVCHRRTLARIMEPPRFQRW
jgi:hypothetical protein